MRRGFYQLSVSSLCEWDTVLSRPPETWLLSKLTTHKLEPRAEVILSRSLLLTLPFHLPLLLSALLFSPLASSLILPFLTSGAFTFLLTLAFFSLSLCVKESLSVNQSVTHSSIPLVSDRRDSVLLVACRHRLSRSVTLEVHIKSSFLFFLSAAIALSFIGCLLFTLAHERGTGY